MEIAERIEPPLEWKLSQPTVWATLPNQVRIQQLLSDKFQDVAELIRTQLIPRDTLCKALDMATEDPASCDQLVQEAVCIMKDGTSLVGLVQEEAEAVEGKWRAVAALIARVINKRDAMDTFARVKIYDGETYKKCSKLINHVIKMGDLFSTFDVDSYFRIYHIVVHEDYKNQGVALFLGKLATLRLTHLFKQSLCVKVCPDRPTQQLMRRLGFAQHLQLGYEEWLEKGQQLFFHTGVGNYSIALMLYQVSDSDDVNAPLEDIQEAEQTGEPTVFPGRTKTGVPSVGNRGHLIRPTRPTGIGSGKLADHGYLFAKAFDPAATKTIGTPKEKCHFH